MPTLMEFEAIWDTGATKSVITQKVIDGCGLAATGMAKVQGVHGGWVNRETYLVNIGLPNKVMMSGVIVTKGEMASTDVLIGMDVITMGDFSVTNCQGLTKFSFRAPSIEHIDYVEQANKLRAQASPSTRRAPSKPRAERRREKFGR